MGPLKLHVAIAILLTDNEGTLFIHWKHNIKMLSVRTNYIVDGRNHAYADCN